MSEEQQQLPTDLKTQSLSMIGDLLNQYYINVSSLIRYHYEGNVQARDSLFPQAIHSFYLLFSRLKSNLNSKHDQALKKIETILLKPNYEHPDQYIEKELFKAQIKFNEILVETGLDQLVKTKPQFYDIHIHKHT